MKRVVSRGEISLININLRELNGIWFGLACSGEKVAATALGSGKQNTLMNLLRSLPPNAKVHIAEKLSDFAEKTILTLERLHRGIQEPVDFALASEYLSEPRAKVLKIAAQIPVGYVASYGAIAKIAGTKPRTVGQIMATNPLYPIVPCHRVVGTDFSLVGYGGTRTPAALKTRLTRLSRECKGYKVLKAITVGETVLQAYPVERAIEKARKLGISRSTTGQLTLARY